MSEHCVLYVVESRIVLKSMLPAMLETRRQNISIDVYVPDFGESDSFHSLYEESSEYITGLGFNVFRTVPENRKYDVAYSAYPWHYQDLTAKSQIKYHVRFKYGLGGANVPSASYLQSVFNYYDFIICLGEPDAQILSGHAKTVSIGDIKLADYKRTRVAPAGKKTLLYLPTWVAGNRVSSVNAGVIKKLIELQDKYRIIAKMHSAMQHFEQQREYRESFGMLDNVYDVNAPISELLNEADVVLSDLSGGAFDAVAGDVPLALFGLGEPVYLDGKLCLHQQLVKEDIIPGTNDLNELETVIEKALAPAYIAKAQKLKKEIFLYEGRECVDAFMRFQDDLFEDHVDPWYIATRRAIRVSYIKERQETQGKIDVVLRELAQKQTEMTQTQGELAQKQTELTQTQGELAQKQTELTKTQGELAQKQTELTQTQGELVQKQTELTQTQGELALKQTELTRTQGVLMQKQTELTQTQGELMQIQTELTQTKGELVQKQTELTQTYGMLTQTQGALVQTQEALNQSLSELARTQGERDQTMSESDQSQKELNQTRGELAKTREELDEIWCERAQIKEALAVQKDTCAKLASQIAAMENTRVWRYTKPLRKLYGLMNRK